MVGIDHCSSAVLGYLHKAVKGVVAWFESVCLCVVEHESGIAGVCGHGAYSGRGGETVDMKHVASETRSRGGICGQKGDFRNEWACLEVVDGGTMDRVVINNISMQDVQTPLFIRLGNRRGKGILKNIIVSNIVAENQSLITSSITGIPGSYVENVTLRDIMFSYTGGADENDASIVVPEKINEYPENRMFGPVLPAYGLYIRHVKNLTMENIQCRLRKPDYRPAFIFDDVHNVSLNNFQVDLPQGKAPIVYLNESSDVVFSGFRTSEEAPLFLKIDGEKSRRIDVRSVNFDRVRKETECGETVKEGTIYRLNSIL